MRRYLGRQSLRLRAILKLDGSRLLNVTLLTVFFLVLTDRRGSGVSPSRQGKRPLDRNAKGIETIGQKATVGVAIQFE